MKYHLITIAPLNPGSAAGSMRQRTHRNHFRYRPSRNTVLEMISIMQISVIKREPGFELQSVSDLQISRSQRHRPLARDRTASVLHPPHSKVSASRPFRRCVRCWFQGIKVKYARGTVCRKTACKSSSSRSANLPNTLFAGWMRTAWPFTSVSESDSRGVSSNSRRLILFLS